jgi:hypothetical protein
MNVKIGLLRLQRRRTATDPATIRGCGASISGRFLVNLRSIIGSMRGQWGRDCFLLLGACAARGLRERFDPAASRRAWRGLAYGSVRCGTTANHGSY